MGLTCTPPRKFRTAKGELVAGKPGHENGRSENPQARSGVTQARIPRLFRKRRADRGHDVGRGQNRQFGDLRHSVAVRLVLTSNHERRALGVEAKMQRVSAMLTYVVNEGRLCALKPSEWSILLAGVAICGVGTLVFLTARL